VADHSFEEAITSCAKRSIGIGAIPPTTAVALGFDEVESPRCLIQRSGLRCLLRRRLLGHIFPVASEESTQHCAVN